MAMPRSQALRRAEEALLEAESYAKAVVTIGGDPDYNRVCVDAADTWTYIAKTYIDLAEELRSAYS